jgi:hypothetical protein
MNDITFRWSVWGHDPDIETMLSHSVATFRRFFGQHALYLVFSAEPDRVRRTLRTLAEVIDLRLQARGTFDSPACTWRKWQPSCRLNTDRVEFYVDSDMFLLADPDEIWRFCTGEDRSDYICTVEPFARGYFGHFSDRIDESLPRINAGLVGQQKGADLTPRLTKQYLWWTQNVGPDRADYHDEQGAVRAALEDSLLQRRVTLLPSDRYTVACPLNDPPLDRLDGVVLLHTTFPGRPAFWKFHREISHVSGLA